MLNGGKPQWRSDPDRGRFVIMSVISPIAGVDHGALPAIRSHGRHEFATCHAGTRGQKVLPHV